MKTIILLLLPLLFSCQSHYKVVEKEVYDTASAEVWIKSCVGESGVDTTSKRLLESIHRSCRKQSVGLFTRKVNVVTYKGVIVPCNDKMPDKYKKYCTQ